MRIDSPEPLEGARHDPARAEAAADLDGEPIVDCARRRLPRLRSASNTRSRPMTDSPGTFFRSALTVSAMPDPIHSSAGSRVMFANVTTAIEFSGAAAGGCRWLPEPLRIVEPCRSTSSRSACTRCRSAKRSRAVW